MSTQQPKTAPIPVFALARQEEECFDCFVARVLITAYEFYKEKLTSHLAVSQALGLPRASLYSRIKRARQKLDNCEVCQH